MYNNDLKMKFIQQNYQRSSMRRAALIFFKSLEKYEEAWGADICTRGRDELNALCNEIVGPRARLNAMKTAFLKSYLKWCVDNNIDGAKDELDGVSQDSISAVRRTMVSSPFHLQSRLDLIFDAEEEETADNILRGYIWLAFCGMFEDEAIAVTGDCVDLHDMVIRFNHRECPIYAESMTTLRNCAEMDHFTQYNQGGNRIIKRAAGQRLMRGRDGDMSAETLRSLVSRKQKFAARTGIIDEISYSKAWLSGLFFRMYEIESSGVKISFDDIISPRTRTAMTHTSAVNYKTDYELWKSSFHDIPDIR